MDVKTISQTIQTSKTIDNVYAKSVILEVELFAAEMQVAVSNIYGKIQCPFVNFRYT